MYRGAAIFGLAPPFWSIMALCQEYSIVFENNHQARPPEPATNQNAVSGHVGLVPRLFQPGLVCRDE